jgi:hypothetical protein
MLMISMPQEHMSRLLESSNTPFKYCVLAEVFSPFTADALLSSLEVARGWRLARKSFYEQYELSLRDPFFHEVVNLLKVDDIVGLIKDVEREFELNLERRLEIVAHRLLPGQGIGLHNDSVSGWETHRLTVTLNRGFEDRNGGHLVFFNSDNSKDIHRVFRPLHNSAVSFELTPRSFHAVSDVTGEVRHSIVFSFWRRRTSAETDEFRDERIKNGLRFLEEKEIHAIPHSGSVLTAHLKGTASILREWALSLIL